MRESPVANLWEKTKFGESILIEFNSVSFPSFGVYSLINWAKEKGYNIVVVDVLDTLKIYMGHEKIAGLDTGIIDDVTVIKIGGRIEIGKILARILITEEKLLENELTRLCKEIKKEKTIIIILGIEKVLSLYSTYTLDVLSLINFILSFIGEEWKKSFYFINVDMMSHLPFPVLQLLEEFATTVIKIVKKGSVLHYTVLKALNVELDGFEGRVNLKALKNHEDFVS
ncbi:DUF257 family protein [Pyrococcus horikoshii]|uniref:KaiC-like domain-containing protein n=2 Tax=Pyrococcus horikoshii TaxID=53953 RepID=O58257_PYRHO|nr:DUF257 family protein [Pyrococcus horikoshii]BAA29609.1 226aa long hypothetical protein [Pyrococcus horikoshii OT3]HII60908.1 DUF257 family protein [Pyrococcus horikoshii]